MDRLRIRKRKETFVGPLKENQQVRKEIKKKKKKQENCYKKEGKLQGMVIQRDYNIDIIERFNGPPP